MTQPEPEPFVIFLSLEEWGSLEKKNGVESFWLESEPLHYTASWHRERYIEIY